MLTTVERTYGFYSTDAECIPTVGDMRNEENEFWKVAFELAKEIEYEIKQLKSNRIDVV